MALAVRLGLPARLALNVLPDCMYAPRAGVRAALDAAASIGLAPERLIFEIIEYEPVADYAALAAALSECRAVGTLVALDDFGAAYAGLSGLVELQPDIIKIDIDLIRGIDCDRGRQEVVGALAQACRAMGILVIAEGVETPEEARALRTLNIELMQGFLFARPGLECLPPICTVTGLNGDGEEVIRLPLK